MTDPDFDKPGETPYWVGDHFLSHAEAKAGLDELDRTGSTEAICRALFVARQRWIYAGAPMYRPISGRRLACDALRDELHERGWNSVTLADKTGLPWDTVRTLLDDEKRWDRNAVTAQDWGNIEVRKAVAEALGTTEEFWRDLLMDWDTKASKWEVVDS